LCASGSVSGRVEFGPLDGSQIAGIRFTCRQRIERDFPLPGFAENENPLQRRRLGPDRIRHLPEVEVLDAIGDQKTGGLRRSDIVSDFAFSVRGQRHYRNDAGTQQGQKGGKEFDAVRQLKHGALARPQAKTVKVRGQMSALFPKRIEADPAIAIDDGNSPGRVAGDPRKYLRDRNVQPIALAAVRTPELFRPGNAPRKHQSSARRLVPVRNADASSLSGARSSGHDQGQVQDRDAHSSRRASAQGRSAFQARCKLASLIPECLIGGIWVRDVATWTRNLRFG
jgi:hypothetical protein